MKALHPYLSFSGNCAEAMTFYRDCLGGELTLQKISEAPFAEQMPPGMGDQILHSTLTIGDVALMASDMQAPWRKPGSTVSCMLHCNSEEELYKAFEALATGGTIRDPASKKFWGDVFGALTDKFGIDWSLNYAAQQPA